MTKFFDMWLPLDVTDKEPPTKEEFDKMYLGEFKSDRPSDYPELKKEKHMSGIYSHICPECKAGFMGYKRRYLCLDCERKHSS